MNAYRLLLAAWPATITACAGSTIGSGVGDQVLTRPPYLSGAARVDSGRIGHLPVTYQRRSSFDPAERAQGPIATLLDAMNRRLDAIGRSVPLPGPALPGKPPDVWFGCDAEMSDDCVGLDESPPPHRQYRIAVGRPSGEWVAAARQRAADSGVSAVLVVTVEIGQYWVQQRDLGGPLEVRLGTDYVERVPWLTSVDDPVQVVQLTGALMGLDGRAIRIAAEGMLARRTGVVLSLLGVQRLITDPEIRQLLDKRREDLPDRPLVWETALASLVENLSTPSRPPPAARPPPDP